jgi:glycosyltransferase involved in cell wall biosynthesis
MPRVSVVLAAYNHARFVGRAIDSVLQQTFQDFEIVVTDDGSTDATPDVIGSFTDPRISLRRFTVNRQDSPRNDCLARATGEFVAILNSDDEFRPEKLARQVAFMDGHPEAAAVFCAVGLIDEDGAPFQDHTHPYWSAFDSRNRTRFEWLRRFFLQGNCLCHPAALIRRSALDRVGGYNPLLGGLGDLDLWVRLSLEGELHVLDEALVNMRIIRDESNASGQRPDVVRRAAFEFLTVLRHYRSPATLAALDRIFPELIPEVTGRSDAVRLHALARFALEQPSHTHRMFGLELLYEVLSDHRTRNELQAVLGRPLIGEFMALTGERAPLAGPVPVTRLLWPADDGTYAPERSQAVCCPTGRRTITLRGPRLAQGARLHLVPCDGHGLVSVGGITVRDSASGRTLVALTTPREFDLLEVGGSAVLLPCVDRFRLIASGTNPTIVLPPLDNPTDGTVLVTIDLEVTTDLTELLSPIDFTRLATR